MIVEVTMARRGDPFPNPVAQEYDLCLIQALAEGLEMNWRFVNGEWVKVSMRKGLPVQSATINLGGWNIVHVSNPTQFTVQIGDGVSSSGSTSSWTIM